MNYIEKFRQGRKIQKYQTGSAVSAVTNPVVGSEIYRRFADFHNIQPENNTKKTIKDYINNLKSGVDDPELEKQMRYYYGDDTVNSLKQSTKPTPTEETTLQNEEKILQNEEKAMNPETSVVNPTTVITPNVPSPVVTSGSIKTDWKKKNLELLSEIQKIEGNPLDITYWADPRNFQILQANLKNAYYNIGKYGVDGKAGEYTINAIKQAIKDGNLVKDGNVKGAFIDQDGKSYSAFDYGPSKVGDVYEEDGKYYRISSSGKDGKRRVYSVNKKTLISNGKKFEAYVWKQPDGKQVYAPVSEPHKVYPLVE